MREILKTCAYYILHIIYTRLCVFFIYIYAKILRSYRISRGYIKLILYIGIYTYTSTYTRLWEITESQGAKYGYINKLKYVICTYTGMIIWLYLALRGFVAPENLSFIICKLGVEILWYFINSNPTTLYRGHYRIFRNNYLVPPHKTMVLYTVTSILCWGKYNAGRKNWLFQIH